MTGAVVARSLAERRRGILGYGLGLGLMIVWVTAIYPSVETELTDYVDAMPEAMKSLFGMEEISSLAGFLHAEIFSLMGPLVFLALAITAGASTIAAEERDQILPLVLATGVGRGTVVLSKLAALALALGALAAITFVTLAIGVVIAGGGIGIGRLAGAILQLTALALFFGAFAVAVGAATGSKSMAAGVSLSVALAAYLLDALANLVGWLEPAEVISPFHWYAPGNPLVDGLSVAGITLLVAGAALAAATAVITFDRRDVGV